MNGRHTILATGPDGRYVALRGGATDGVYDDEAFYALPLVRQFGGFPRGYAAIHYGADERAARLDGLASDPRDARDVLGELLRTIRANRYAVRAGGHTIGHAASKATAEAILRDVVRRWRNGDLWPERQTSRAGRRGNGYSAPRIGGRRTDGRNELTGALAFAWELRDRRGFVALARVEDDGLRTVDRMED